MKKTEFFIVLFFLFFSLTCSSQTITISGLESSSKVSPLDTLNYAIIRCQYVQRIMQDTLNPSVKTTDRMLLQVGNKISKFFNYDRYLSDSIKRVQLLSGLSVNEVLSSEKNRSRGKINYQIFKNYPVKKNTYVENIFVDYFSYEEDVKIPNWKLLPDTMTIMGYLCKKATCKFYCREYTVWYAPEIAISEGPWKFSGLPGLILKVSDSKEHVQFEMVTIEKVKWTDPITFTLRSRLQKTTKSKFNSVYADYMKNPMATIQQYATFDKGNPDIKSKPYNPIELCE